MEVKDIAFTGLGTSVSDIAVPDGELSVSHNIYNDNGSMRPVWIPEDVMLLNEGEKLVHVHQASAYKNYIVTGVDKPTNHISVFHKSVVSETEKAVRVVAVLEYPAISEVSITIKTLLADGSDYEETITYPSGSVGKKIITIGIEGSGIEAEFVSSSFSTDDSYYLYEIANYDDSEDVSDLAEWHDEVPKASYWLNFFTDDDNERKRVIEVGRLDESIKIATIGNTLAITSSNGLEYALFKDGVYKSLGQKPPELNVQWYLDIYKRSFYHADEPVTAGGNTYEELFDESVQMEVGTQIAALVNRDIAECEEKNQFTSTFFVRWAYRMYNGAYMVSPPVMMPLNGGIAPALFVKGDKLGQSDLTEFVLSVELFDASLGFKIPHYDYLVKERLEEWKDIVDGVDIYVTRGITKFDQDGKPERISRTDDNTCISYGHAYHYDKEDVYVRNVIHFSQTFSYHIVGMMKSDEDYMEELRSAGVFYKLKSYKIGELASDKKVELAEGTLKNLTTSSLLSDETSEYQEHDLLYPSGLMIYNRRLNLYGVMGEKYNFPLYSLAAYTDGYETFEGDRVQKVYSYSVRFIIGSEGQSVNVTSTDSTSKIYEPPLYLFYPDNSATRAIIERTDEGTGNVERAEVVLSSHPYLQGSYWFNGFYNSVKYAPVTDGAMVEESAEERRVSYASKIYTSEIDNPFVFPLSGINSVGTGEVMGISTATQALSQGQFGQFPLYVFSTEGVWAMEVGSNGLYSSVKPMSRDVCVNSDSITQIDNAVIFTTKKGVMMIGGSEVVCLSDSMNGRSFDINSVSHLNELLTGGGIPRRMAGLHVFMEYAEGARMAYDYANNRLFMYRSDSEFCYIYSLGSSTWATADIRIASTVTSYPDIYLQWGNQIKIPSNKMNYNDTRKVKTLVVTRPIKLDSDAYKTIREVVARGAMDRSKGALLLWGSHDGEYYSLIGNVRGTRLYRLGGSGYRYFRVGVVGEMKVGEVLDMVSIGFDRKYVRKLR